MALLLAGSSVSTVLANEKVIAQAQVTSSVSPNDYDNVEIDSSLLDLFENPVIAALTRNAFKRADSSSSGSGTSTEASSTASATQSSNSASSTDSASSSATSASSTGSGSSSGTASSTDSAASSTGSASSSAASSGITITRSSSASASGSGSSSSDTAMPTLTSESSSSSSSSIATPTVTVPSTRDNPFLRTSNLPDGTVFICVGAILGALIAAIVIWRIAAGIALKKRIREAEKADIIANGENRALLGHNANVLALNSRDPTLNGSALDLGAKDEKKHYAKARMSGIPSQGGLFFSPTADVLLNAQQAASNSMASSTLAASASGASSSIYDGQAGANPRSSVYLPAGYYGSNSGGAGSRISRNLSPAGHSRASLPISTTNRLSVNEQAHQRPPSMYLDELLAHSDSD